MESNSKRAITGIIMASIVLIFVVWCFTQDRKPNIVKIDGCEYIQVTTYHDTELIHKEDCNNPIHKNKKE